MSPPETQEQARARTTLTVPAGWSSARVRSAAPPRPPLKVLLGITAISVLGLFLIATVGHVTGRPLFIPPLAATIALIASVPELPLAQPRNVVGGHLASCVVGALVAAAIGHGIPAAALAGGLAVGVTSGLRVTHSPAAATAVLVAAQPVPFFGFTAVLVLTTSALVVLGIAEARLRGRRYPLYWW